MIQVASSQTWPAPGAKVAMDTDVATYGKRPKKFDRKPSVEYHLIFAASFVILLLAAVLERLMPWTWLSASKDRNRASIIDRAWGGAKTCSAYAFMG
jgi:hypothetical protein